jgi:hypothetical protein
MGIVEKVSVFSASFLHLKLSSSIHPQIKEIEGESVPDQNYPS